MAAIRLQLIQDYFYPTDAVSRQTLIDCLRLERFPLERLDLLSPRLVRLGYSLAIVDYMPTQRPEYRPVGMRIGGEPRSTVNPCVKCGARSICDSDECGRKCFRLFSRK